MWSLPSDEAEPWGTVIVPLVHTDPTGVAGVAETVRGMFNLWKSIVLLMQGNGSCAFCRLLLTWEWETEGVSWKCARGEQNQRWKWKNKTKESKSLAERSVQKKREPKKNECRNTAKQCWRELTLEIGSIPKRQIKEAP